MSETATRRVRRDVDGLAVWDVGAGEPVLLMPYWHAFTTTPMSEGALASVLVGLGRRVVTFDAPGAYGSTRTPTMTVAEMVGCAAEALDATGLATSRVCVVGHSAGGYAATQFARTHAASVSQLILISPTGVGDPSKLRALPWGPLDARFWRFYRLAVPVYGGKGTAAQHKAVYDLLVPALHANAATCPALLLEDGTGDAPAPARAAMIRDVPRLSSRELAEVGCPTALITGSCDPIVPVPLAQRVAAWLSDARLEVMEGCGHYPQHERPEELERSLARVLA